MNNKIEIKICEHSGKKMYKCPGCQDWDYDNLEHNKQCRVCFELDNNPEQFVISEEDNKEWNKCAKYIMDHNISSNLDFPESD